jgi:serine/threonine-protein kinase
MKCPTCRTEIPAEVSLCPSCGYSFDDATQKLESPKTPANKSSDKRSFTSFDSIDDARFVPGAILAERYRVVGLLGKGGMGEVYRADDLKLGQPVALKFLPDHLLSDGAALARFHREVRVARQVSHKNVCRVYDIGDVNGHHYLSMEFIKGEELSSLMRRIGRLPPDKALQLARQLCAGLAAAHDVGILHRDLKPANVMIDEHGNARILDFGLAGLVDEFSEEESRAGTPAYMSPEQIEGQEQTIQSDIYALGLLLYELFTGKRAFDAPSLNELIKLRRSDTSPTSPTSIVKDLDPVIEKLIDRCLQRDRSLRPASALQVAAALPGGDPIAAALAAGETPSPEMVAAAPKAGTLRPAVAVAFLAAMVLMLAAAMFLSRQVALHRFVPLARSPELLTEQASQMAKSFGYAAAPADVASGFETDFEYYSYLSEHRSSLNPWKVLKSPQPPLIRFWYRQSPDLLVPYGEQIVTSWDPPKNIPGMVQLSLDTEGKLFYFEAIPEHVSSSESGVPGPTPSPGASPELRGANQMGPETRNSKPEAARTVPDWAMVFRAAGFDINQFKPAPSEWTPPHAYDTRQAWSGVFPDLPQIPVRIEAAGYQGKPVYFEIVSPWSKPTSEIADTRSAGTKAGVWILFVVFFGTMLVGALLALRNLRLGRGDRRGAFRIALFMFLARMVVWVFATHHVADNAEIALLITGIQSALFWSCFVGVMYLALEPYLRRRWPERIISWNRLLAGDFRDPLVGRDVLIGAAIGAFNVMLMYSRLALPRWLSADSGIPDSTEAFKFGVAGTSAFGQMFINQMTASIVQAFMLVFLLLFLSLLLRKDWVGITVGSLILIALFVSPEVSRAHWIGLVVISLTVVTQIFCALRFGPLALMSTFLVFHLWVFYPITTEVTAWYASSFVLILIILLSLASFGFYTSLGGQSVFGGKLLKE